VLYAETASGRAYWVTSAPLAKFVKHAWAGAWICSAFRNEGAGIASQMIRDAVAATRSHYRDVPYLGMVTFVNRACVQPTMVRGIPVWGWSNGQSACAALALSWPTIGSLIALKCRASFLSLSAG
jgi:hypothetical protein